ncbi:MAG: ferritin family protein [Eubacterium sp.]
MGQTEKINLINECNFADVKPAIIGLPYPLLQVKERNKSWADLLAIDYCGQGSEMTSIVQYVNQESRMSYAKCPMAKVILGIAMAEMIHLQKLGELICLLGGNLDFTVKHSSGKQMLWTPEFVKLSDDTRKMILTDIEGEKMAIKQYRKHISMIKDNNINAVLARIIKDEEYHIMLLQSLIQVY